MKKRTPLLFLFPSAALLLAGCSTIVNSHTQKEKMMNSYVSGRNGEAESVLRGKLKEPKWYNSSVVRTGDELVWRLEYGSLAFHTGNYRKSIDEFKKAEERLQEYDDRAKVSVRDASAEAGTVITNLNTLPYKGFCRDRVAIEFYKSLAYLGIGSESGFRAQLRRLRDEQKRTVDRYREEVEAEKKRTEEESKKNQTAALKAKEIVSGKELKDSGENSAFRESQKALAQQAKKGYGNFLNPAAVFLSGLGSIRDGNFDNASVDFKNLYRIMPKNPLIRQYCATVCRKAGKALPAGLEKTPSFPFALDRECVYVIFANGRGPALTQGILYFPIMVAWPKCEFYPAPYSRLTVRADGKERSTGLLADMDGVFAQEFNERLPGIITRIVFSTLVKEGAYHSAIALVAASNMGATAKALTLCGIIIGGAVYRGMMNTADTRSWEMLPKEYQLTQFPMPKNREVTLLLNGSHTELRKVKIPASARSAILFVEAPGSRNVRAHVLPFDNH